MSTVVPPGKVGITTMAGEVAVTELGPWSGGWATTVGCKTIAGAWVCAEGLAGFCLSTVVPPGSVGTTMVVADVTVTELGPWSGGWTTTGTVTVWGVGVWAGGFVPPCVWVTCAG